MPTISEFYGIKIYMYWDEHNPPHFHAEYAEFKAIISINESVVSNPTYFDRFNPTYLDHLIAAH